MLAKLQDRLAWFDATENRWKVVKYVGGALAAIAVLIIATGLIRPASAEGVFKGPIALPKIVNTTSWTGCGVGVGAALRDAEFSAGGMGNIGFDGQSLGFRFLCDLQAGSFVLGFNVDYDRIWGDLQTIGGDAVWSAGGRIGPLINANTLLFVSGGWTRANTSGGDMDGWYFGGGIETKLPSSPIYLVLEYQHRQYDLTDIGGPPGVDFTVGVIRIGANIKLHFGN